MTRYYQTDTGYGAVDDDTMEFPDTWTEITQEQYEARIAADAQAAADAEAALVAASAARWTTVYDELVRVGVSAEAAELLANAVGVRPV